MQDATEENKLFKSLYWLAGINSKMAAYCTDTERNTYRALGSLTIIPALLAALSLGIYTASQGFGLLGFIFGPLAGVIVLLIDRALLATYNALESTWRKRMKILVRISVGVIIGVVVTHPLLLWSFRDAIRDRYVVEQGQQENTLQDERKAVVASVRNDYKQQQAEVTDQLTQVENKIQALQNTRDAKIEAGTTAMLQGKPEELQKLEKDIKGNAADRAEKMRAKEQAQENLNNARRWLNQEGQFGLNERDDRLSAKELKELTAAERKQRGARTPGFQFGAQPSDPTANPPAGWAKGPRMSAFWDSSRTAFLEITRLDEVLSQLARMEAQWKAKEFELQGKLRSEEAQAHARAATKVDEELGKELQVLQNARNDVQKKQSDLNKTDLEGEVVRRTDSFDTRLKSLAKRIKTAKEGGPIDTMQQTQSLIDEVLNPMASDRSAGSSVGRRLASIYELLKYFALFMVLDLSPIVIKCLSGATSVDRTKMREQVGTGGAPELVI